jgi:serine/threonine protein kinase
MPSLSGLYFDRYHLLEPLGEGGMATVYLAFDTRLERRVALKVIRTDYSTDSQFLKRFDREARVLARLSHPHIVQVLDVGEHAGMPYVVMEYLAGGTLKARIGRPLLPGEAGALLAPIARALAHAHRQGIVHRDVKPANILLTPDGTPKLSDFGIAKIFERPGSTDLTASGVGVGTPDYMAPEQWLGQSSPQSDIYSLGVVLYELLAGRRPFAADTPVAVLLKHINDPLPNPRPYAPDLPEAAVQVLWRALAKKPEARYAAMEEFATALESLQHVRLYQPASARPWMWLGLGGLGLATLSLGCLGVWAILASPQPALPETPGASVPEAASGDTPTQAAVVQPTDGPVTPLAPGLLTTSEPTAPPVAGELASSGVDASATPANAITESVSPPAGQVAFYASRDGNLEIYTMTADGSGQTNLTRNRAMDWLPAWSPDGARLAFVSDREGNEEIYIMNADGSGLSRLTFDPARDEAPDFSPDGQRIVFQSDRTGTPAIYVMNVDGTRSTLLAADGTDSGLPKWSPDGTQILFQSKRDGDWDVYVMNADGSGIRNLTLNTFVDITPDWAPDGTRIVFSSNRETDHYEIYTMNAAGGDVQRVTRGSTNSWTPVWSADGQILIFATKVGDNYELFRARPDGQDLRRLTESAGHDQAPDFHQAGP